MLFSHIAAIVMYSKIFNRWKSKPNEKNQQFNNQPTTAVSQFDVQFRRLKIILAASVNEKENAFFVSNTRGNRKRN